MSQNTLFDRQFDILYLSSDILISSAIHSGAGGLGVVAGSIIAELEHNYARHTTSTLAVGFYCSHGYQTQFVNEGGVMEPHYKMDLSPEMVQDTGKRFKLILHGRECWVAIRLPVDLPRSHTAILLLDTDIPENNHSPDFQMITRVLYGEGHATAYFSSERKPWENIDWMRVLQAAVLGLGGFYAMRELEVTCNIVHCNDSHPVFYLVHELGLLMKEGLTREQALTKVQHRARFTNHTVLESGNKRYPVDYVMQIAEYYAGFDEETLHFVSKNGRSFRMTTAALHLVGPGHANAVSKDHARIASDLFGYNLFPITNGVFVPEYQHAVFTELEKPEDIPRLKRGIKEQSLNALRERARAAGWPVSNVHLMDWLNSVLLAWARRCQGYKRPGLMWHHTEFEFVKKMLDWRFISVAWGGLVHPDDTDMLRDWNKYFRRISHLPNVMPVFNYRLDLMRPLLKATAQIWLNTPQYGFEACGTSWMSAMLNCALVVSIPDGGVIEAEHVVLFGSDKQGDWHQQYEQDAAALWQTLLPHIVNLRENDPRLLRFLYEAKLEAEEKFSATRMVDEYRTRLWCT